MSVLVRMVFWKLELKKKDMVWLSMMIMVLVLVFFLFVFVFEFVCIDSLFLWLFFIWLLIFVLLMIGGFWVMVFLVVDCILVFVGDWLFNGKKVLYGFVVMCIFFGVMVIGLLVVNFSICLYMFGLGLVWNGEFVELVSDFLKIWVFSVFYVMMGNDVLYMVFYLFFGVLVVLFVLGWCFCIVLLIFFCFWVGFIEVNDMVGD